MTALAPAQDPANAADSKPDSWKDHFLECEQHVNAQRWFDAMTEVNKSFAAWENSYFFTKKEVVPKFQPRGRVSGNGGGKDGGGKDGGAKDGKDSGEKESDIPSKKSPSKSGNRPKLLVDDIDDEADATSNVNAANSGTVNDNVRVDEKNEWGRRPSGSKGSNNGLQAGNLGKFVSVDDILGMFAQQKEKDNRAMKDTQEMCLSLSEAVQEITNSAAAGTGDSGDADNENSGNKNNMQKFRPLGSDTWEKNLLISDPLSFINRQLLPMFRVLLELKITHDQEKNRKIAQQFVNIVQKELIQLYIMRAGIFESLGARKRAKGEYHAALSIMALGRTLGGLTANNSGPSNDSNQEDSSDHHCDEPKCGKVQMKLENGASSKSDSGPKLFDFKKFELFVLDRLKSISSQEFGAKRRNTSSKTSQMTNVVEKKSEKVLTVEKGDNDDKENNRNADNGGNGGAGGKKTENNPADSSSVAKKTTTDNNTVNISIDDDGKIPVTIITGFLGSGKTTLLNKILREKNPNKKIAVIENEFGEIGIDDSLIVGKEDLGKECIIEMNNGCKVELERSRTS